MDRAADVILAMRLKGVRIWSDNGQLRYKASGGVMTPADLDQLKALKSEILALVQQPSTAPPETKLAPREPTDEVPLTFAQQAWWTSQGLDKHHGNRSVFTAVRLRGPLNIPSLRRSFTELVLRHPVLRTTIKTVDGTRQQLVGSEPLHLLDAVELLHLPEEEREAVAERLTVDLVTEPVDAAVGPLFAGRLVKLRDDDHILTIAIDHLISDAASMGILLRDLWTLYAQAQQGLPFSLPAQPIQFADFAVWQAKSDPVWNQTHGPWWTERLRGARQITLFAENETTNTRPGVATFPIAFGKALSAALRDLSRRERAPLAMTILCVYGSLALRWCDTTDLVIPFLTMGRAHPELEKVIGFFGCPLYLRLRSRETDSFLDLLRRINDEYALAHEHHDSGRISARTPRPGFTLNLAFNWYPAEFQIQQSALTPFVDGSESPGLDKDLRLEPFTVKSPLYGDLDINVEWGEGGLVLTDTDEGITGAIVYRADRSDPDSVSRFGRDLLLLAESLVQARP